MSQRSAHTHVSPRPLVGVSCCLKPGEAGFSHTVGDKYVDAVLDAAGAVPLLIPALGERTPVAALIEALDGLFFTGSPSNVDPSHYDGPPPREGNEADPERDATTLPLLQAALDAGVPVFAVCRGIQELNVVMGGSLHQHVHELPGKDDHRSDKSLPHAERYAPRHHVTIQPDGVLAGLFPGQTRIEVNSLHGQAIDRLAKGLRVEAITDDGLIEAVSVEGAKAFALGVQWHPEFDAVNVPERLALFQAFGAACAERAAVKRSEAAAGLAALGAVVP